MTMQVNKNNDWAEFLKNKNRALNRHIDELQEQIDYYKQDRFSGWFAAALLGCVLAYVMYEWLYGIGSCGV